MPENKQQEDVKSILSTLKSEVEGLMQRVCVDPSERYVNGEDKWGDEYADDVEYQERQIKQALQQVINLIEKYQ